MDKTTSTISLPRTMKHFIEGKLRESRFSTPSEYIRSPICNDQDMTGNWEIALLLRRNALYFEAAARPPKWHVRANGARPGVGE